MLRHYFTIAVQNLIRHRGYSLINILGLSVGMACCILILLDVQYELGYDRFHEHADQIYRVVREERAPGRVTHMATVPAPLAPAMEEAFPEIQSIVRFRTPASSWMLRYEDKGFFEFGFYLADPSVFDVFSIPMLRGDPKTVLSRPFTIVLTEETARKYFGDEDPIGKVIRAEESMDLEVTGIMASLPKNSHLKFDILASMVTDAKINSDRFYRWRTFLKYYTYMVFPSGSDPALLEKKLPALVDTHAGDALRNAGVSMHFSLQPLTSIHLYSHLETELSPNNDINSIILFAAIAIFILMIACINFMNLATARATMRAKEVGLRKVVGAQRLQLITQFLSESMVLACLSAILSVVLVKLFLPTFNTIVGKDVALQLTANWPAVFGIIGIVLFVGIVSGAYPAFVLSSFQPVAVIGRMLASGRKHGRIRKILVVAQFTISITLLICTGIVSNQLYHLRNKPLGLNPERLIYFPMTSGPIVEKFPAYKREIQQHPGVLGVTVSYVAPGLLNLLFPVIFQAQEASNTEPLELSTLLVDLDYLEVMGMEMATGRFFRQEDPDFQDPDHAAAMYCVINETAVRQFGWDSAEQVVGQRVYWLREGDVTKRVPGTVVGVIKDFYIRSLHEPIEGIVLIKSREATYGYVKIAEADVPGTLASLHQVWQKVQGQAPFEYRFMDEAFARLYDAEERIGKVFGGFALVAVILGCLGLFGLASFTVTRRTREIGIRKVLGASVPNIVRLISKEFLTLVLLANILAWPLAYYGMAWWLQNFAYRIDIGIATFLLAGIVALAVAMLTVSTHAFKATRTNPVDALRNE